VSSSAKRLILRPPQAPYKSESSADQAQSPTLERVVLVREACVGIKRRVRWFAAALLLLPVATASGLAGTTPAPAPSEERPATVVVRVSDDGFHWVDAGLGAAAALATTLLAVGLVVALRPTAEATQIPLSSRARKESR
jgi:hypothetical protein